MIIEGGSYSNGGWWGRHVQNAENNERIEIREAEGFSGQTVEDYFQEMHALSKGTKCTNYFYQYNIDPSHGERLSDEQWKEAHAITRKNHGLEGLAYFTVRHTKNGEQHEHGFVCRIDPDLMKARSDSFTAQIREQTARELEEKFGLAPVKSVLVADRDSPRPQRRPKKWEQFRGAKSGIDPKDVAKELAAIKERSDNGQSFKAGMEAAGYGLARGDRRDFVVMDQAGDDHSLARRLGMKAAELSAFMKDVDPATLPGVSEAKTRQHIRETAREDRQRHGRPAPAQRHRNNPTRNQTAPAARLARKQTSARHGRSPEN